MSCITGAHIGGGTPSDEGTGKMIECEGSNHAAGTQGHAPDAPAAWRVRMECPRCEWSSEVNLCAPRVRFIRRGAHAMTCYDCGSVMPWADMWQSVEQLETLPRIGRAEPVTSPAVASSAELVAAFVEYLEARQQAAGTIKLRRRHLEELAAALPSLATATPEQLDEWARARAEHLAPATVNSLIKSVRAFYRWADRFGIVRPNPTTLLDLLPNPHRMGRTVSDDQLAAVLAEAPPEVRAMLLLGRLGGLRLTEIATLRVDARVGDWLTIVGKGSKQRRVYIVPGLADALDAITTPGESYYFPARPRGSVERIAGGRWRVRGRAQGEQFAAPHTFSTEAEARAWLAETVSESAGHLHPHAVHKIIRRHAAINPHALRHAAGTAAYRASKDLRATQAFLGHSSPSTTAIYVHVAEDDLRAVTEAGALRGI